MDSKIKDDQILVRPLITSIRLCKDKASKMSYNKSREQIKAQAPPPFSKPRTTKEEESAVVVPTLSIFITRVVHQ